LIAYFNAGVREARGQWIGLLRPGIQLAENWDQSIESAFAVPEVAAVSPIIVSAVDQRRVVAAGVRAEAGFTRGVAGMNQRLGSKGSVGIEPLGPTSWAAFYRRTFLVALDECDESLGSNFFDLDLALSFHCLEFEHVFSQDCILTCAEAEAQTLWQEATRPHGCSAERAFSRFGSAVDVPASLSTTAALLRDLLTWPWRWQNVTHARQRQEASRFKLVDEHYRGLLSLLREQRTRLVSPGLHARVAAHQRSGSLSHRKAA
jgi:hypothetical protein